MGFAEKLNPNSEWYQKRHPTVSIPIGVTPKGEAVEATVKQPKHRLVNFIKKLFNRRR